MVEPAPRPEKTKLNFVFPTRPKIISKEKVAPVTFACNLFQLNVLEKDYKNKDYLYSVEIFKPDGTTIGRDARTLKNIILQSLHQ